MKSEKITVSGKARRLGISRQRLQYHLGTGLSPSLDAPDEDWNEYLGMVAKAPTGESVLRGAMDGFYKKTSLVLFMSFMASRNPQFIQSERWLKLFRERQIEVIKEYGIWIGCGGEKFKGCKTAIYFEDCKNLPD